MYKTCPLCGLVVPTPNVVTGSLPVCKCTFTTSDSTTVSVANFNKHLKAMRNWKVTLHGQIGDQRKPVPQAFQDAFSDGELEP